MWTEYLFEEQYIPRLELEFSSAIGRSLRLWLGSPSCEIGGTRLLLSARYLGWRLRRGLMGCGRSQFPFISEGRRCRTCGQAANPISPGVKMYGVVGVVKADGSCGHGFKKFVAIAAGTGKVCV